jgi:hypothetical protein
VEAAGRRPLPTSFTMGEDFRRYVGFEDSHGSTQSSLREAANGNQHILYLVWPTLQQGSFVELFNYI